MEERKTLFFRAESDRTNRTVGSMEAAVEPTRTYLRRVLVVLSDLARQNTNTPHFTTKVIFNWGF